MKIVLAGARLEPTDVFNLCADPDRLLREVRTHNDRGLKPVATAAINGKERECWVEISEGPPLVLTLFAVHGPEVHVVRLRREWRRTTQRLVLPSEGQWRQTTGRPSTEQARTEFAEFWREQRRLFEEDKATQWCAL